MKNQKRYAKPTILILLVITSFLLILPSVSSTLTGGRIIQSGGSKTDLSYDTASDAYTDNVAALNPNAALRIYGTASGDVANKYVAGIYGVGKDSGNLQYVIITTGGGDYPLTQTGSATSCGGSCYYADTSFALQFASIIVGSKSGNAGAAFYPSNIYIVVSNNNTVETTDSFISLTTNNGTLSGSYGLNNVQASYNQNTGNINVNPQSSSPSAPFSDHPSNNFLMVGVCNDTYGVSCADTTITDPGTSKTLNTSIVNPPDSTKYTRYAVVNGIGTSFCIGPNVRVSNLQVNPSVTPAGPVVNVSADVDNVGNVDITSSFNVSFYDQTTSVFIGNYLVTGGLTASGSSKKAWVLYNTTGLTNGAKTMNATALDAVAGIDDCSNSNDVDTGTLNIELVYLINFTRDGVQNDTFPYPGRPHNVTITVTNSNGNPSTNTTIKITEEGGLSLLAPTQTFTHGSTKRGVKPVSIAQVITDNNGQVSFTMIPTGNKLYTSAYSYTNVTQHVGNYSLYLEIFDQSGNELQLFQNNQKVGQYNLTLQSQTAVQPNSTQRYSLDVLNENTYVKAILNFIHQIRTTASLWI